MRELLRDLKIFSNAITSSPAVVIALADMLLSLPTLLALHLASASAGFVDDCPGIVDPGWLLDNGRLVNVLETFYTDLVFVRASTESRQARDYAKTSEEVRSRASEESDPVIVDNNYQTFHWIFYLLQRNQTSQARFEMNALKAYEHVNDGREMTYLKYIEAEICRFLGDNERASTAVMYAFLERQQSEGVSLDVLERADGLVALQRVSQFNRDIDWFHGLATSPNQPHLSLVHMMLRNETMPLHELRFRLIHRLYETAPAVGRSYRFSRLRPNQDNLSEQSVSHASARGMLCEFVHKLYVLGVANSDPDAPADYSDVIDLLAQTDAALAVELNATVVTLIGTHFERAKDAARQLATDWSHSSARDANEVQEVFVLYFNVELQRQSADRCNLWELRSLLEDFARLKSIRGMHAGVSLRRMVQLEGNIVLLWLECFHERLKLAFELTGDESEQQLADKLTRHGTCRRIVPDSALMRIQVRVDP